MNDTVVIDGEINLLSMIDGDLSASIPADALEYESGVFSPETKANTVIIEFKRAHDKPPMMAVICDTEETYPDPAGETVAKMSMVFSNYEAFGIDIPRSATGGLWGTAVSYLWRIFNDGFLQAQTPLDIAAFMEDKRVTNTYAKFSTGGAFLPSRTYKWIAIWR